MSNSPSSKALRSFPHLAKVALKYARNKPFAFSFDVADRCSIGCDCYWRAKARVHEMSDEEVIAFFHKKRKQGFVHATLIGGEPYVRADLLAQLTRIMPASWVVTSANTPLRWFPNTTHFVSVDGADAATHNAVRRSKGLFERINKNLTVARGKWGNDFPVFIHSVVNGMNIDQLFLIMEYWKKSDMVDGVVFSTSTPIAGGGSSELLLTREQREGVVEQLYQIKAHYGDFLTMSPAMIDRLHPKVTELQTPKTCKTARFAASFDASGERVPQCVLGAGADCSQCGCVITAFLDPAVSFAPDLGTFKVLLKTITI